MITNKEWNNALNILIGKAKEYGDTSCGGSGEEIITSGPKKGERYGEVWYQLEDTLRTLTR